MANCFRRCALALGLLHCAFVLPTSESALSTQSGAGGAAAPQMADYYALMADYIRRDTPISRCLEQRRRGAPPLPLAPDGSLISVGVEGSGHHLVEGINYSLCHSVPDRKGRSRCGLQQSFPSGWRWRASANVLPAEAMPVDCTPPPPAGVTFLVLLRDPVDTFASAMGRHFQRAGQRPTELSSGSPAVNDTFAKELEAHYEGWRRVSRCVQTIPCNRTWFLSYELLVKFPQAHAPTLAALFAVGEDNPHIQRFVNALERRANSMRKGRQVAPGASKAASPLSYTQRKLAVKLFNLTRSWNEEAAQLPWARKPLLAQSAASTKASAPLMPQLTAPPWFDDCYATSIESIATGTSLSTSRCLLAWRKATTTWFYDINHALDVFPSQPQV
mmetsp:Transcript_6642/g.15402  ORF Transcript_6642/g.15402 Transcript_6642/m.15402 type:complete len:388 (-) Transcript_6642:204-1367(-)